MKYLDTKKAANRLGVSLTSIYRYADHGLLKAKKVSNEIFFSERDLKNFVPPLSGRPKKSIGEERDTIAKQE